MIRIGISGFGRIGRLAARVALRRGDMEVVAINAPDKTPEQIAYVFSHDSVHGKWEGTVSYEWTGQVFEPVRAEAPAADARTMRVKKP